MILKPYGFKDWLARRLLNFVYDLMCRDWPNIYDAQRGWRFDLRWKQPIVKEATQETLAEKMRRCLDRPYLRADSQRNA